MARGAYLMCRIAPNHIVYCLPEKHSRLSQESTAATATEQSTTMSHRHQASHRPHQDIQASECEHDHCPASLTKQHESLLCTSSHAGHHGARKNASYRQQSYIIVMHMALLSTVYGHIVIRSN